MNLKNTLRTLFRIRAIREPLPPGPKPAVGSNIVRNRLRIRLRYPISGEQWEWFTEQGWRAIDMRTNQRRYICVPDKVLVRLLGANGLERDLLHQRLITVKAVDNGDYENKKAA
jgi:hypothetical protein